MSEEIKKIEKIADEAQATELTVDDLEQITGGGAATTTTPSKAKTADKAFSQMDGYIKG